ncbi:hypothetical protein BD289DRAFT_412328 [Coniella lustricola]|uniref:CFEM domain-containing protein n=1 Tax=Coniella lustricola TaxID=2025994 RepID=A0A2T3A3A0_9PEZI|nr:hypothetical protein BD289DRAFT_412328 [Coniella lustricola]
MRSEALLTILLACSIVGTTVAQSIADLLAELPSCGLPCIEAGVISAACSVTNTTLLEGCLCTNNTALSSMSTCVQTSCQFSDQVTTVGLLTTTCADYPIPSRVNDIRAAAAAALALSVVVVSMRCAARVHRTGRMWSDDWTAAIAALLLAVGASLELASAQLGFGLHYWDVAVANATVLLQMFYALEIIYTWIKLLAKASIVVLYMRVFPSRPFHMACYACLCYCCLSGISFSFAIAFQCQPVSAVWNRFIDGKCLDVNAIGYAGAVLSIFEDIVLVLLPIPELRKLQISSKQRAGVGLMFGLASFATITSIIRLNYIVQFSNTYDTTYDDVNTVVWSMIEATCIIVCGSLPPLRPWVGNLLTATINTATKGRDQGQSDSFGKPNTSSAGRFSEIPEPGLSQNGTELTAWTATVWSETNKSRP